jgi:hypothetical protein
MSLAIEELAREIGTAVSRSTFSRYGEGTVELRLREADLREVLVEACALALSIALGEPPPRVRASLPRMAVAEGETD